VREIGRLFVHGAARNLADGRRSAGPPLVDEQEPVIGERALLPADGWRLRPGRLEAGAALEEEEVRLVQPVEVATDFSMRRARVSGFFVPVTWRTCQDLFEYDSFSNVARAAGSASRATARSAGTSITRGAVSSSRSTSTASPPTMPAGPRWSELTPIMYLPPSTATVLRYVYPLIVTRTGGRLPAPRASTTSAGTSKPIAVLPSCRIVVRKRTPEP
jgi:hypothetical protein